MKNSAASGKLTGYVSPATAPTDALMAHPVAISFGIIGSPTRKLYGTWHETKATGLRTAIFLDMLKEFVL
jgi:hypothetical protein